MSRTSKKERDRLKRKAKRKQAIRLKNESPYRRVGSAGTIESCLINDDWRERGMAVVYALASVPGRPPAMAVFLVDLWCAGLKDAWGRLETSHAEFHEILAKMADGADMSFVDCDVDAVRCLIAGSLRIATENGFRLPPRYERWLAVIGGVGNWAEADVSDFGVDGKFRWVGPIEDLRRRLVSGDIDEFLGRDDVVYIMGIDDDYPVDETGEMLELSAQMFHKQMLDATRRWCFANGEAPHPRLPEAVDLMLESAFQVEDIDPEDPDDVDADALLGNVEHMLDMESPEDARELAEALDQTRRFVATFPTYEDMIEALGIDAPDEDDLDEEDLE